MQASFTNDENMSDNGTARDAVSFLNKMGVCPQGRSSTDRS
jgi:hypothetical protein